MPAIKQGSLLLAPEVWHALPLLLLELRVLRWGALRRAQPKGSSTGLLLWHLRHGTRVWPSLPRLLLLRRLRLRHAQWPGRPALLGAGDQRWAMVQQLDLPRLLLLGAVQALWQWRRHQGSSRWRAAGWGMSLLEQHS